MAESGLNEAVVSSAKSRCHPGTGDLERLNKACNAQSEEPENNQAAQCPGNEQAEGKWRKRTPGRWECGHAYSADLPIDPHFKFAGSIACVVQTHDQFAAVGDGRFLTDHRFAASFALLHRDGCSCERRQGWNEI